nr:hypothetical protein [Gammaproteobacteria bacterium]
MKANKKAGLTNWRHWFLMPILITGVLSIIASGGGDDDDTTNGEDTTAEKVTITGSVTGSGGISGVHVKTEMIDGDEYTGTSDDNGFYLIEDVPVPSDGQLVLTYEKVGYATYQRSIPVAGGETYSVAASLMPFHFIEENIDVTVEQNLDILDPADPAGDPLAEMVFPPNSMGDSGEVMVSVGVGDPTTEEGAAVFPGDYMAATTEDGEPDTPLESIVFTEVTITDDQGKEITNLAEPATLSVRLPDELQLKYSAGDSIPWWSYDETNASWIREDADPSTPDVIDDALIIDLNGDGVLYAQGKVTHMSWWNVDEPIDQHSCVCTTVLGDDGNPLANQMLTAEGVTYNGVSQPASTDSQGFACVTVKRSTDTVTERIKLYVDFGGLRFHYDVIDPTEGDVVNNEIFTPTIEGSTVYNTGECVTLANNITAAFDGEINGTVINEGTGLPAPDFTIYSSFGESATTNANGEYVMSAPVGVPVSLYAIGLVSQTVTVLDAATPLTVNFVIPNQPPVIESLTRVPEEGAVENGQTVALAVTATDPEGGSLSYAWSANAGSLDNTNSTSVNWTAPASGYGTATISVTVTDAIGDQASQSIAIVYGDVTSGTSLSFTIKDNVQSDQPVSGVTVALYDTDNTTILRTETSDANGIVDFGDVGRTRVSFTIVYGHDQFITSLTLPYGIIRTYIDVPTAEGIVYYTQDSTLMLLDYYASLYADLDYLLYYYYLEYLFDSWLYSPIGTAEISLNSDQVIDGAYLTRVLPVSSYWYYWYTDYTVSTDVYATDLQQDDRLTLLAMTHDAQGNLLKWGMLEDQGYTDGAAYTVNLSQDPVGLGWTTTPETELQYFEALGFRQGVEYYLARESLSQSPSSSGLLPVAMSFPADNYWVGGETDVSTVMSLSTAKAYTTLPQSVDLPIPDYSFSSVTLDGTNQTLSWTLSGTSSRDLISIDSLGYSQDLTTYVEWQIVMPPGSTSLRLMELPAPADAWTSTSLLLGYTFYANLSVMDWDLVDGYDEVWGFFLSGGDFDEDASLVQEGTYDL